jgi:hypothetical protein
MQDFHDDASVKPVIVRRKNLRFMEVDGRVLLWFKKIDRKRNPAVYPTENAIAMQSGQQLSIFPDCTILIVGYLLNRDETDVVRVSISKPNGRSRRPAWFIDLEPTRERKLAILSKSDAADSKPRYRVVVKHGAVQDTLINS